MTGARDGGRPVARLGLVGLGVISEQYLATLRDHPAVAVVAVADLRADRAAEVAASLPSCRACTPEELLAADDFDLVVNLTVPAAHADIARAAIAAGTAVFGEKPLATTFADAALVMAEARAAGVAVGSAPDTVLGTGVQTARAAVEAGLIGTPTAASATWVSAGHERWHPNPDFYYLAGGGPLFDMGPYYLTSLVHLLGPVVSVVGEASRGRGHRVIGAGPRAGERIPVEIDTHVTGVLRHASGALSTVAFSFDAAGSAGSPIEVHGETGSLAVPDPNYFDGTVRHLRAGADAWEELPASAGYVAAGRGIGVLDMIRDATGSRPGSGSGAGDGGSGAATVAPGGRASGEMALHVTEIMTALSASAEHGRRWMLDTTVVVPPLVPLTPEEDWRR
ncbi:Gfo/Idh/MocA family protein [Microbacterium sp. LMI1-1-1.1]|uniref:Gfo/Idh/MocA family protein n=1 Tax=Microbacterium sp. LMI1-1-1.1 TaxID=3135223 RepID=UPI00346618E5